jgi:hypothetical protein
MRKTILASLFALLLVPGLAAAAVAPTPAPAPAAENAACNPSLSGLGASPLTPADNDALAFAGLEGIIEVQSSSCCQQALRRCRRNCDCGVFEFNCDPVTCQSNCICNICP